MNIRPIRVFYLNREPKVGSCHKELFGPEDKTEFIKIKTRDFYKHRFPAREKEPKVPSGRK